MLTLSLPIFWQFCFLSATFILTARGTMERQAYRFSKIVFFYLFFQLRLTQILNLKYEIQEYFEHYVRSVNEGTWIRLGKGVQVADRRHWQSAMTSPIGDVGSERVKAIIAITLLVTDFMINAPKRFYDRKTKAAFICCYKHLFTPWLSCLIHMKITSAIFRTDYLCANSIFRIHPTQQGGWFRYKW